MSQKIKNNQKKSLIPWIFVIFFAIFIIVDIIYIYIANQNWRGLYTENSYQKGLNYNQTIAAKKEQKKLGWKMLARYQPFFSKKGAVIVELRDRNSQIISDADITVKITRPVQEGYDFTLNLKFDAKTGSYQSLVKFPLIGQWNIEIIAKKGGDYYQDVRRWIVK